VAQGGKVNSPIKNKRPGWAGQLFSYISVMIFRAPIYNPRINGSSNNVNGNKERDIR